MKKQFKYTFVGHEWTVLLHKPRAYVAINGKDSVAIVHEKEKELHFRSDELSLEAVIHEVVHVYAHMFNLVELVLDEDQTEEFFCELFAKHGEAIIKESKHILKRLTKK